MSPTTLFTMTVDTEEEWDWSAGWPTGDLSVSNVLRLGRFQDLCERYGVAPTYFTNHAVLASPDARAVVLDLARRPSVEIGMHIHPWNTPPVEAGAAVAVRDTFLHNLPDGQIRAKLATVHDRFAEFALRPTSFRGGRYSSGGAIHDFLRDRRFVADASVVPFTTWDDDGSPDYRDRDLLPRRLPPRSAGEGPLWEIPLTLAFSRRPFGLWHRVHEIVARTWLRKARLIGLMEKAGVVRKLWLNFEVFRADDMLALLRLLRTMRPPCVTLTVHSSSLMAGGNPYTKDQADEDRIYADCEAVFAALAGWDDFRPATVSQVAHHLEEEHHARPRDQSPR